MIKKHLKTLIVTSLLTLLPIIFGIIYWDVLPDEIATHFGANGTPDGFSSKAFVVFGMPFMMLVFHLVCFFGTNADPKRQNISDTMMKLVLWIIPCITILVTTLSYSHALGKAVKAGFWIMLFMGVVFIIVGNYMPKCKQSYTMGIKLPWTLSSEENWNKTHRLGGKLWVAAGVIMMLTSYFENVFIMLSIVFIAVIVPTVYSYTLFTKENKNK